MRELPNDHSDFARKQGTPADHTEKTGGIHRDHQTGMDTGVKGVKCCIKLLWTRGESRGDGR